MIKTGPRMPMSAGIGLAVAAPVLTWWAIGAQGEQMQDHAFGPYHVSLALERLAGVAAILVTTAALVGIAMFLRAGSGTPRHSLAAGTTLCLVEAGVAGAAGWRVQTAGVVGANIGAGLVFFAGPILIAGLLVGAVLTERQARGIALGPSAVLMSLAVLVAPALMAVQFRLSDYDRSIGVISASEYATVQPGEQHSTVRERLGRPGDPIDWWFTPVATGTTCDYYTGKDTPVRPRPLYQLCYRDAVLVFKNVERPDTSGG